MSFTDLATIKSNILQKTDYAATSGYIQTTANGWLEREIKKSIVRLWGLLDKAFGDAFVNYEQTITTAAGTSTYDLDVRTWRIRRVDWVPPGSVARIPLKRLNLAVDPFYENNRNWQNVRQPGYWWKFSTTGGFAGDFPTSAELNKIVFDPIPQGVHSVRIIYVPNPPPRSVSVSPLIIENIVDLWGYEDWVENDVAIKIRAKDEGDASIFIDQKREIEAHIIADAPPFDEGQPQFISDMRQYQDHQDDLVFFDR